MKLYTKTGDDGFTQQPGGQPVGKDSPCIEAVGSIDELSAQIGLCFQAAEQAGQVEIAEVLAPLQAELFGVGSLGMIMATLMFYGTIGGAYGAPLAGSIFDVTGSYNIAFIICIVLGALAVILSLILLKTKSWLDVVKE